MREITNETTDWLQQTLFFLPTWKWLALIIAIVAGFLLLGLVRHLVFYFKQKVAAQKKIPRFAIHFFANNIQGPSAWLCICAFWFFSLQALALPEGFAKLLGIVLHVMSIVQIMRLVYKMVEAIGLAMEDFAKSTENTLDDQLAPFATKVLKIIVITLGILLSLQSFGFNVGAVLAGLGIGSLAFALAAQDTAANLFGSITIILDRPFQRGDWIKTSDTEGIVEEVGFRSTRIRTLYNSLVTIPNATMAKEKIDNLGVRTSRRIRHNLGIAYGTPKDKILNLIDQIRYLLVQNPHVDQENITVTFYALGDFDLKILVNFFVFVPDTAAELQIQQDVLLEILAMAKQLGVEFAFPTQTLHVATLPS